MAIIAAVHDLSGLGRCSLQTAISVLSAMGHQCCPMPTAVLSAQTGFSRYTCLDFTPYIPAYMEHWRYLGFLPDMVYTGFLGNERLPGLLADWCASYPEAVLVVDPVMGDGGTLYPCFNPGYVREMKGLLARADIITPNLTEFLLLTGNDPEKAADLSLPEEEILRRAESLPPKVRFVVITGIFREKQAFNLVLDRSAGNILRHSVYYNGVSYSGTGDLFASVLCGAVASGAPVGEAAGQAAGFVERVVLSMSGGANPRYGIRYEPFLRELPVTGERGGEYAHVIL